MGAILTGLGKPAQVSQATLADLHTLELYDAVKVARDPGQDGRKPRRGDEPGEEAFRQPGDYAGRLLPLLTLDDVGEVWPGQFSVLEVIYGMQQRNTEGDVADFLRTYEPADVTRGLNRAI